jgi:hypothetical protein
MKTFIPSTILALFISGFIVFDFNSTGGKFQINKEDSKFAPDEAFISSRIYPATDFSANAYKDVLLEEVNKAKVTSSTAKSLSSGTWQVEGPHNIGGRIMAVAVNKLNQNTMLIGAAAGGIFKTKDGGINWYAVFDNAPYLSISDITYDPTDTNVVYVATGDKSTSFYSYLGDGIYKSVDGGETWGYLGLNQVSIVSKILVNPNNSSILYASAQGNYWTKDLNRGLYKSIDGGLNWNKILATDSTTGICDIEMDALNPNTIYAVSFTRYRTPFVTQLGGPACKVYKSTNGGANWSIIFDEVSQGLSNIGKMGLALSEQNSNKLFLSVTIGGGVSEQLYSSTNGGTTWNTLPATGIGQAFGGFSWYFDQIYVNPFNDNNIILTGVNLYESTDGGNTFTVGGSPWFFYDFHADKHDLKFINATQYIATTDGGTYKLTLGDSIVQRLDYIPITQLYRVTSDPYQPNFYFGGAQDNGGMGGNASNINNWPRLAGGDGFTMQFPQFDSTYFYYTSQNGNMIHIDKITFNTTSILNGINQSERKNWDFPYMISKYNDALMYCGTDKIYEGDATIPDQVQWTAISPNITKNTNSNASTIRSIDEGLFQGRLVTGTGDGNVYFRSNTFSAWQNITSTLPNRTVTCVKFSPNVNSNIYVSQSGYKYNEYIPHLHRSTDNGVTWQDMSSNLPNVGINDIYVWDGNENIIFIANDLGVYFTTNAGASWQRLGSNMPLIPVYDIDFNNNTNRLFAGTFARSIQSIDVSSIISSTSEIKDNGISIRFYPNPTKSILNIDTKKWRLDKVEIYDLKSQLVLSDTRNDINLESLKAGYYYAIAYCAGQKYVQKIIKE